MSFYPDEIQRIEDAQLILLGIQPSELEEMTIQQRHDVLAIAEAQNALSRGKMPGQK